MTKWKNTNSKKDLSFIQDIVKSNRQILKNMTMLGALQFANYLIPLLIMPYIVRVLGADVFGKITYAQNIISYFTLIINFGFDYSATREIAVNRDNKNQITQIFWSVLKQKAILLLFSFVGLVILYFTFYKVSSDFTLYLFVFLMNVGIVLLPTWFFQGMEEMGKMAIFNFLIKGLGLVLTVILVKSIADYLIYPLITSLIYIAFGLGALLYVIKYFDIKYIKTGKAVDRKIFKSSFPIFLNSIFVSGYTIANMTILGFYATDTELGYYSGAFKIIMAILMVTSTPISMAIYPVISRKFAESKQAGVNYFIKSARNLALISLLISVITFFAAPVLVKILLGNEFVASIDILRMFSSLPFLVIMASLFTIQGIYGAGLQRYAPWIGASLGLFCIIFNLFAIPIYGMYAAAWGWIISEFFEIIIAGSLFYFGIKKSQNKNII